MRTLRRLAALSLALTLALVVALVACSRRAPVASAPPFPPLPPLQLRPLLAELKAVATRGRPAPAAATLRELQELLDVALHPEQADARTLARAERALCEHAGALAVLEPALAAGAPQDRARAAALCGRTADPLAIFPLLLRLKYENDPEAVLQVADALHRLGNDTGLPWLDAAMNQAGTAEPAGQLAVALLRAAGVSLGDAPTWAELQAALRARSDAWSRTGGDPPAPRHCAAIDARVAAHLVTTEGTALRPVDDARWVLTRLGQLGLPLLRRTLQAGEPYLRTMALQVVAELGPAAAPAADDVLPLLGEPLTASYAARALGELGAAAAAPHLRARLLATDTELRTASALALGLLRDQASGPRLAELLAAPAEPADVRVAAAFARLCLGADAAAEQYLAARERAHDYHAPTLQRLRERLAATR